MKVTLYVRTAVRPSDPRGRTNITAEGSLPLRKKGPWNYLGTGRNMKAYMSNNHTGQRSHSLLFFTLHKRRPPTPTRRRTLTTTR